MRQQTGRPLISRPHSGGNHCDFCGTNFVTKLYACNAFEWEGNNIFHAATGRWAACGACAGLIDADKWAGVVTRAMRSRANQKRGDLILLYMAIKAHMRPGLALTIQQVHYARRRAG